MIEVFVVILFVAVAILIAWDVKRNDNDPSDWKSDM